MRRRAILITVAALAVALWGFVLINCGGDDPDPFEAAQPPPGTHSVTATVETEPVPSPGDAADDPAIWIDRSDPARSTVIGTDNGGGIAVYDLAGNELQYRPDGAMNNVDLREGFPLGTEPVTIVAATDRDADAVAVYQVDPSSRELIEIDLEALRFDFNIYGLCMYRTPAGEFGFFVTDYDDGRVERWALAATEDGRPTSERMSEFRIDSPAEGCVVDDDAGIAYFAEEQAGIWRMPIEPAPDDHPVRIASAGEPGFEAEIEGLALAHFADRRTQLVASSQGDNTFAVFDLGDEAKRLYSFEVVDGIVDAALDTDGIEITTENLGPDFPYGILVVQDGYNDDGNQNFKLVPLCARSVICP